MSVPIPSGINQTTAAPKSSFDLSSIITPVTGIIGSLSNFFSTLSTNKSNQKINNTNLDYQTKMTQAAWERDDTAHQREVADLEAAGLSPLANTTGNQVTSPLSAPNPIAMQAPQLDTNTLVNALLETQKLSEDKRHNMAIEGQRNIELQQQAEQLVLKADELDIQNKQVEGTIRFQAETIQNEMNTLAEVKEHNDEEEYLRRLEYENLAYWKEINQQVPGNYRYEDIYDIDYYEARMKLWNVQFKNFMEKIGATQKASANSKTESSSTSVGGSVGATAPGTPFGANIGANGTQSGSTSESNYEMENLSEYQKQLLIQFYNEHPKPVYHLKRWRHQ